MVTDDHPFFCAIHLESFRLLGLLAAHPLTAARALSAALTALTLLPLPGTGVVANTIAISIFIAGAGSLAIPLSGAGQIADAVAVFVNKFITLTRAIAVHPSGAVARSVVLITVDGALCKGNRY
jgi:hypothetical protein